MTRMTEVEVHLHHETAAAYKVSLTGDEDDAVWVPKSSVEMEGDTLVLPEQMAIERGLV